MKINADHYHSIGTTHHFCQDFSAARHRDAPPAAYALVCDGCSSVAESHIGSMLLGKAAEPYLYPATLSRQNMTMCATVAADSYRRAMGLIPDVLSATLLTVVLTDKHFLVSDAGDGVIVMRKRDGTLLWITLEYTSGAPWYPRYMISPEDSERYYRDFPGHYVRTSYNNDGTVLNKLVLDVEEEDWHVNYYEYPLADFDMIGILSDGAFSFYDKEIDGTTVREKPLILSTLIHDLFSFKGTQGEFVKRRCIRLLRDYAKIQRFNSDDFSIGVVSCE